MAENKLLTQASENLTQEDTGLILLEQSGVSIFIDGVDKTRQVKAYSLRIENVLTTKRDIAEFSIMNHSGDTYLPRLGQDVKVYDTGELIFGGVITGYDSTPQAFAVIEHSIKCQDYTRLLDHKLIPDAFEGQTADYIIDYLRTNYFPAGFTIDNVDADVVVEYIKFNYRPLSQCLQDLADMLNFDWYVDYTKDVHFFARESVAAPFNLTDDNGTYEYNSLIIRRDNSQIRNSIIVRGGEYLGSQLTADIETNGVDYYFPLPYRFADFAAHLTGHILSVGIDAINDPNNFDALYNFQEKILKFKAADTPSAAKTLKVSGKPYLPVIVRYKNPSHIAAMVSAEGGDGIYEYLIEDKTINSKEGARQRAQAEIAAYAQTLSEAEFITTTPGLKAGQLISVQSDSRGIDESFVINKVTITQFSKDTFIYKVSLITTKTYDLVDVLQRMLLDGTKKISVATNETVDVIQEFSDAGAFSESMTVTSSSGPYLWGAFDWGYGVWGA